MAPSRKRKEEDAAIAAPVAAEDLDLDMSSDIKGILSALQQFRKKTKTDGQKRNDEIINSVTSEIKALVEDSRTKCEKERQNFVRQATKACKDCETSLKSQAGRYHALYEKFCKEKEAHQQAYEDAFAKFEEAKDNLLVRYEQQRKREKVMVADLHKTCSDKIAGLEEQMKKKKLEEKSFLMLRKSLDSFLEDEED